MDEQKDIADELTSDLESNAEPAAEPAAEAPSEPVEDAPAETEAPVEDPQVTAPPEDNGDQAINKAEAAHRNEKLSDSPKWQKELQRFHDEINATLAEKENFKLVALDKKVRTAFARLWKQDSNRFFQLAVNIRRRKKGAKFAGKNVA